jgi:LysR family nitrogen assimilation transcriptional regulator
LRLRQLKYFISIVEHGGFTKAAVRLFVAQSALSLQMKKLEEELATPLFVRNAGGVQLSRAGEVFLRHARLITAQVAACDREIRELSSDAAHGVVRIGIAVSLSRVLTIPLLHAMQTNYPGVSLHVIEALTHDMERGLEDGTLDLGIVFGWTDSRGAGRSGQGEEVLRDESLYLVSPKETGARTGPPIDLADLVQYELVVPTTRYATRRFMTEEAGRRGLALQVRYELDSLQQTLAMILDGDAHSIMSMSTFISEWHAGKLRARPISGLSQSPQLQIRLGSLAASRAVEAVKEQVHATAHELAENGKWPRTLEEKK